MIKWKDGSTTWEKMIYAKECNPLKLVEYSHQVQIYQEPEFAWWIPHVMKKRNKIISKVKSKYWNRTHKYGVRITKSVKEVIALEN